MLEELKQKVYEANMELPRRKLITYTWGNVSGIDREKGLFVIKPSGVDYDDLKPEHMVVMDLQGNKVEGDLNPSSDTKTHLELYNAYPQLRGIVHTHSPHAVAWAQANRDIPCYGTTHADYFYGPIPCARNLTPAETDEYAVEAKALCEAAEKQGVRIEVRDVSFRYQKSETMILNKVSFSVEPGQVAAFVGPSGGGKTTVLRIMLSLLQACEGTVTVSTAAFFKNLPLFILSPHH